MRLAPVLIGVYCCSAATVAAQSQSRPDLVGFWEAVRTEPDHPTLVTQFEFRRDSALAIRLWQLNGTRRVPLSHVEGVYSFVDSAAVDGHPSGLVCYVLTGSTDRECNRVIDQGNRLVVGTAIDDGWSDQTFLRVPAEIARRMIAASVIRPPTPSATQRPARRQYTVTIDSIFDEFRDDVPIVYAELERTETTLDDLYLRAFHERCQRASLGHGRAYVIIFDFGPTLSTPSARTMAARNEFAPVLEYSRGRPGSPRRAHGVLAYALLSDVLIDSTAKHRYISVSYKMSEDIVRDILLDPTTALRFEGRLPFRLNDRNRDALRFLLDEMAEQDLIHCP